MASRTTPEYRGFYTNRRGEGRYAGPRIYTSAADALAYATKYAATRGTDPRVIEYPARRADGSYPRSRVLTATEVAAPSRKDQMTDTPNTPRVTAADRAAQVRAEAKGLASLIATAQTEAEWAEVARRAGAIQRRSRQLAGLGRGG